MLVTAKQQEPYFATPRRGTAPRTRSNLKVVPEPRAKARSEAHPLRSALAVLSVIVLVFGICAGVIYFKCLISAAQLQINSIQQDIEALNNENSRLRAISAEAVNPNTIRLEAQKLGMGYPDSDQIRYVGAPEATLDQQEGNTSIHK